MRSRGSVLVVAALFASSLMLAPAQLAEALADAPNCLELISRTQTLQPPDGASYGGPMSDDGRYVAFTSAATNLGPADANGAERDVFVRDTSTGTIDLVSQSTAGTQVAAASEAMAISSDGRFVLFASLGALVDPDLNGRRDLFVRDRLNSVTTRVSTDGDSSWSLNGTAVDADLSDDGRYVAYVTAEAHAGNDTNAVADVYRLDLQTGTRVLVSVADDESILALGADGVTISGDGNVVLFHSSSIGAPGARVAAVRDIVAATTRVIGAGNARVNRTGRYVALLTNTALSVTDLQTSIVENVDTAAWGAPLGASPKLFGFSATGRYLLLGWGVSSPPYSFYVVDRVGERVFKAGPETAALAYLGDGGLVSSTNLVTQAYVWRGPVSSISMVAPASIEQATSVPVTLTGENLLPGTAVDFGAGVAVSNFQFVSLNEATVTLTVDANAATGARQISVTATSGCGTTAGGLEVTAAPPPTTTTTTTSTTTTRPTTTTSTTTTTTTLPTTTTSTTTLPTTTTGPTTTAPVGPAPSAASVTPALVRPGDNRSISINGTNFVPGASVAVDGISVVAATVLDSQHIVAVLSVPANADGVHTARVTNPNGRADAAPPAFVVRGSEGEFHSMQPYRSFDSRWTQPIVGERVIQLTNLPAIGVRAVAANLTVTGATAGSYLTTFAAGTARPNASSINFRAGETKANMVTLSVNAQGQVAIYNFDGAVDVIIDVVGWYSEANTDFGSVFIGVDPFRRFDSRVDRSAPLGAGEAISLPIVGSGSTATAVMLNVTVTEPTATSYLTVSPTGTARPGTSNINYVAGDTVPNVVIVPIGAAGSVDFFNFTGDADVIVDVLGVFEGGQLPYLGGRFASMTPTRALDTRLGTGGTANALSENSNLFLDVRPAGVPSDATAVVMNVTVAAPTTAGYLTVWPAGGAMPGSSNLNFSAGQVTANLVVVPLGSDGRISMYNAFGSTHVIADVVGYYR